MSAHPQLLAATIDVGKHPTAHFLGLTFNIDTMYTSTIAAVLVLALMWWVARTASHTQPSKMQVAVEAVLTQVRVYVTDAVGHEVPAYLVPLGFALFFFILFCNWLEWIPSGH